MEKPTISRKIDKITEKENNAICMLCNYYNLNYKEGTKAIRMLLNDVIEKKIMSKIDEEIESEFLDVPVRIVNYIARQAVLERRNPSRSKTIAKTKEQEDCPNIILGAKKAIDLIESGERVTVNKIRKSGCPHKYVQIIFDAINRHYIPKENRLKIDFKRRIIGGQYV